MMKKLILVLLAVMLAATLSVYFVSAEENDAVSDGSVETSDTSTDVADDTSKEDDMSVKLEFYGFGNEGFARNLKYMGLGMLGIFVVVGVVILITFALNSVSGKKQN